MLYVSLGMMIAVIIIIILANVLKFENIEEENFSDVKKIKEALLRRRPDFTDPDLFFEISGNRDIEILGNTLWFTHFRIINDNHISDTRSFQFVTGDNGTKIVEVLS